MAFEIYLSARLTFERGDRDKLIAVIGKKAARSVGKMVAPGSARLALEHGEATHRTYPMREMIQRAERAYAIQLQNRPGLVRRYQVYLLMGGRLEVLWPKDGDPSTDPLILGMIQYEQEKFPKFHWSYRGGNFSAIQEIKEKLTEINPALRVEVIGGYAPSNY